MRPKFYIKHPTSAHEYTTQKSTLVDTWFVWNDGEPGMFIERVTSQAAKKLAKEATRVWCARCNTPVKNITHICD
jgi:aminoglycoside phosphotransferase